MSTYLVTSAEIIERKVPAGNRAGNFDEVRFKCELSSGSGRKCYFDIRINGSDAHEQTLYELVRPYFKKGNLINCSIAYLLHSTHFSMAMYGFVQEKALTLSGRGITGEEYINPRRGYWVRTVVTGQYVYLPGIIPFHGDVHIPLRNEGCPLKHMPYDTTNEGLRWSKRRSIWELLFG